MVGEVVVDLFQPKMMQKIVDEGILGIGNGGNSDVHLVVVTGIKMILVVLAGCLSGVLSAVFTNIAGQNFGNDIRKYCFRRIMHFSFEQTDDFTTGSLVTRITNDVTQLQQLVMQIVRGFVRCLMFFIGGTIALLSLNLSFGVVIACAFPLIILHIIFVVWKTNPLFLLLQKMLDKMNTIMQENVAGNRVVKAFVQEEREKKKFGKASKDLVDTQFKVQIMLSFLRPVMNIVLNAAVVGIIYIGSIQVKSGDIAPGAVMAAITYISQILNGMMMLAMIFQTLSRGIVSAKRLEEIVVSEPVIKDGERSPEQKAGGTISFRNVSFTYPDNGVKVLNDINLDIQKGETVAVIGATGSGKTSLVNLIPRFYDVTEGEILVDGVNVRDYRLNDLRNRITVCLQKSELFSTTIRDNIAIGRRDATEEEIKKAAVAAQADEFIVRQKDGYDTKVAEGGMSLSGGQKQRIAISRALLRKSEILIFDDSTSALDLKTEAKLYEALNENYKDVTKIIIAQRIASIKNADRIVVLDGGSIAAVGTHEELLKENDVYKDIYESQLKSQDEERGGAAV
ncbi:MAG TPA: multidrug ABC transporter ATP-binding protein [Lachnospiraceae bacterium]|nr:multidrug ABC transporter ATP-binding protein [Lachnospiraceae bacterium]